MKLTDCLLFLSWLSCRLMYLLLTPESCGYGHRLAVSGFRLAGSGFRLAGSGFRSTGSGFRSTGSVFSLTGS